MITSFGVCVWNPRGVKWKWVPFLFQSWACGSASYACDSWNSIAKYVEKFLLNNWWWDEFKLRSLIWIMHTSNHIEVICQWLMRMGPSVLIKSHRSYKFKCHSLLEIYTFMQWQWFFHLNNRQKMPSLYVADSFNKSCLTHLKSGICV
jgi:hypothetical protein